MKRLFALAVGLLALVVILALIVTLALEVHGASPVAWVYAAPSGALGPTTGAVTPSPAVTQVPLPAGKWYEGPANCHSNPTLPYTGGARQPYASYIVQVIAPRYQLETAVLLWQVNQESGFNPDAKSASVPPAEGIAQFLPGTAAHYGIDPWNPWQALDGMARYDLDSLRSFWGWSGAIASRFGGNRNSYAWGMALAAYNAGGAAAGRALGWADRQGWADGPWTWLSAPAGATGWDQGQTSRYVRNILGCW